jgi:flagellar hook-length control protein FliK
MSSLPITPPSARAGTALHRSSSSPPGAGSGDFAALLSQTSARTAPAEGPKTRPQDTRRRDDAASRKDDAVDRRDDAKAAQRPADDTPKAPDDAAGTPQQPAGDGEPPATPQDQAPAPPADPVAAAAQAAAAEAAAAAQAAQAKAPAAATAPPAGAAPATGPDGLPLDPKALLAAQAGDQPAPVADPKATLDGKLQIPAELLNAQAGAHAGHGGKDLPKDGAPKQDLPPAPTLPLTPAAAPTAVAAGGIAHAEASAAPPTQAPATPPTVAQGQPTATPLTAVPTAQGASAVTRGAAEQTADRVQELVRIATTRSGGARATLQLKPEALGQVDVHLRTTREGLVATIAAHDQVGLDALQQAGTDIRRLLEDRGVQLHSLDLQLGAGADGGFGAQRDASEAQSGRSGASSGYGLDEAGDDVVAEDELTISTTPLTATSALVDVTA